jgi:hypothetical protein
MDHRRKSQDRETSRKERARGTVPEQKGPGDLELTVRGIAGRVKPTQYRNGQIEITALRSNVHPAR